ncbi:hypothetical protein MF265_21540 [Serratia marcescens]|uniref:scabin-related ADP-ribosyltransferase n=1 Tax=Serratia marcescens TaxID=615 RepID=UPI001EEFEB87|nr:hypothetical protein [Serratia marcescens]ULH10480.1 hypothetical protein MF265_21540 [Serratia marcescens]
MFHGDELGKSPEFVFETGLTSAAPVSGKMDMGQRPSEGGLSSFSYYSHIAKNYAKYSDDTGFGYIYISTAPGGLNVGLSAKNQGKFDTEAEVAYMTGVHTKFILGALKMTENPMQPVAFIQNKNHEPGYMKNNFKPESGDVLIIHSSFPKQSNTITTTENMLKLTNVDTGIVDYYNTTPNIRKNGLNQRYKIEVVSPQLETLNVSGWYMNGVKANLDSSQVEIRLSEYACDSLLIIEPIFSK